MSLDTATLPSGWEERLVPFEVPNGTAHCIDIHDCVVSKLVAGREKDMDFATSLLRQELLNVQTLIERSAMLPQVHHSTVRARVERCAINAGFGAS